MTNEGQDTLNETADQNVRPTTAFWDIEKGQLAWAEDSETTAVWLILWFCGALLVLVLIAGISVLSIYHCDQKPYNARFYLCTWFYLL